MPGSLLEEFGEPTGGIYCPWLRARRWDDHVIEDRLYWSTVAKFVAYDAVIGDTVYEEPTEERQTASADFKFEGDPSDLPEGYRLEPHIVLRDGLTGVERLERYDAAKTQGLYRHLANCPPGAKAARDFIAQHGFPHEARATRYPLEQFERLRETICEATKYLDERKFLDLDSVLKCNADGVVLRPVLKVRYRSTFPDQILETERFLYPRYKSGEPTLVYSTEAPSLCLVAPSLEALMFYQLAHDAATLTDEIQMKQCPQCNSFFKAGPGTKPFRRIDSKFCSAKCRDRFNNARRVNGVKG